MDLLGEEACRGEVAEVDILGALDLLGEEACRDELDILRLLGKGPASMAAVTGVIKMSEAGAGDKVNTAVTAASNGNKAMAGADDKAKLGKKKTKTLSKDQIRCAMEWSLRPKLMDIPHELIDKMKDAKLREDTRGCLTRIAANAKEWDEQCARILEQYNRMGYAEIEVDDDDELISKIGGGSGSTSGGDDEQPCDKN